MVDAQVRRSQIVLSPDAAVEQQSSIRRGGISAKVLPGSAGRCSVELVAQICAGKNGANVKRTIEIYDDDRSIDYCLEVEFALLPVEPENGLLTKCIEINTAKCTLVTTWCGDCAVSALPANDERKSLESKIGDWCVEHYAEEIENELREILES